MEINTASIKERLFNEGLDPVGIANTGELTVKSLYSLILLLMFMVMPAQSQDLSEENTPSSLRIKNNYINLQTENDVLGYNNEDKYYTNGIQLSFLRPHVSLPTHDWVLKKILDTPAYLVSAVEFSLGQKMFTPRDHSIIEIQPDDRPYAGWLFLNASSIYLVEKTPTRSTVQIIDYTVGILGPGSLAEEAQRNWHSLIGSSDPRGWDHQLDNELGLGITVTTRWHLRPMKFHGVSYDVSPHVVSALGNVYTYFGGGVMLRMGRNIEDDFGPPTIRPGFPGSSGFIISPNRYAWYFFIGHESRIVLRNIFLDGNSFKDGPEVDRELLVGDYQFGFVFRFKDMRVAISNMIRTREFDKQATLTHYGAISCSFGF